MEIKWGGHIYSAYCEIDASAAVTVALKDLRDIVCRRLATHRECKQLEARQLCQGTPFGTNSTRDEMSLGSRAAPTMIPVDKALKIVAVHAPSYADRPEVLLELMLELGHIPAKLVKAARGTASQTAGES